jgi:hypothetical protein
MPNVNNNNPPANQQRSNANDGSTGNQTADGTGAPIDDTVKSAEENMNASFAATAALQTLMLANQARLQALNMTMEVAQGVLASIAKAVSTAVQTAKDGVGNAAKAAEKIQ